MIYLHFIISLGLWLQRADPLPERSKVIPPSFIALLPAIDKDLEEVTLLREIVNLRQEVNYLKRENLRLQICSDVGFKMTCLVDWKTMRATLVEK